VNKNDFRSVRLGQCQKTQRAGGHHSQFPKVGWPLDQQNWKIKIKTYGTVNAIKGFQADISRLYVDLQIDLKISARFAFNIVEDRPVLFLTVCR